MSFSKKLYKVLRKEFNRVLNVELTPLLTKEKIEEITSYPDEDYVDFPFMVSIKVSELKKLKKSRWIW